ncbi:CHAT domain-containing protein [Spirulina sp. CS-785/01]|uniref:CHAT domain-containing protein n=1 Tax=Spirulina sp. CS-785/01 TaxID=3021716 RepID=UPI00232E2205|nr:CHAT domain-containing protein [Spirulina sp. CS-785/01]MDB9314816.1 CHAT domain-containing protein [Spirulina sp. CS-785/01]
MHPCKPPCSIVLQTTPITGDGVVGLSRAFFAAGTASLVATLWKILDTPTAVLMNEFYRQLQHTPNQCSHSQFSVTERLSTGCGRLMMQVGINSGSG